MGGLAEEVLSTRKFIPDLRNVVQALDRVNASTLQQKDLFSSTPGYEEWAVAQENNLAENKRKKLKRSRMESNYAGAKFVI